MDQPMPVWLSVAISAATALFGSVGTAAFLLWLKWRRARIDLNTAESEAALKVRSDTAKVISEEQAAELKHDILKRDDQIQTWKNLADQAAKRAGEAEAKADRKEEEWSNRMEAVVTRYRDREASRTKQMEDRELQFQEIVDKIRADLGAEIASLRVKHEECIREGAEMRGELREVKRQREEDREEHRKEMEEIKSRLDAKDARRR